MRRDFTVLLRIVHIIKKAEMSYTGSNPHFKLSLSQREMMRGWRTARYVLLVVISAHERKLEEGNLIFSKIMAPFILMSHYFVLV
jgi:hypothetical protein